MNKLRKELNKQRVYLNTTQKWALALIATAAVTFPAIVLMFIHIHKYGHIIW